MSIYAIRLCRNCRAEFNKCCLMISKSSFADIFDKWKRHYGLRGTWFCRRTAYADIRTMRAQWALTSVTSCGPPSRAMRILCTQHELLRSPCTQHELLHYPGCHYCHLPATTPFCPLISHTSFYTCEHCPCQRFSSCTRLTHIQCVFWLMCRVLDIRQSMCRNWISSVQNSYSAKRQYHNILCDLNRLWQLILSCFVYHQTGYDDWAVLANILQQTFQLHQVGIQQFRAVCDTLFW